VTPNNFINPLTNRPEAASLLDHLGTSESRRGPIWQIYAASFVFSDLGAFGVAAVIAAVSVDFAAGVPVRSLLSRSENYAGTFGTAWHGWGVILILTVIIAQLNGRGHYAQRIPFWTASRDIVGVGVLAAFCDFLLATRIYGVPFGVEQGLRWTLFIGLALLFRSGTAAMLSYFGLWHLRTLVVGPSSDLRRVKAALISEPSLGFSIVAALDRRALAGFASRSAAWHGLLNGRSADYVVLVADPSDPDGDANMASAMRAARIPFAIVPTVAALPVRTTRAHYFISHDIVLMSEGNALTRPVALAGKRLLDVSGAILLIVLLSPLLLAIAALVRRDGGPVLYRHKRVGAGGRSFGCIKFRSMDIRADDILTNHLASHPAAAVEWHATQKLRSDPRITAIGRILRQTSLDELPQLLNVIRGEMSLVGPRPIVQSELRFYGEHAESYMKARPGLTGLWQVSGRSNTSYDERVKLDVWYVRNWTFWHDVAILLKTIPVVLFRRGAV
jgi:UDP-galactose-lipid carrier transferase